MSIYVDRDEYQNMRKVRKFFITYETKLFQFCVRVF